jgi:hypothetical protein
MNRPSPSDFDPSKIKFGLVDAPSSWPLSNKVTGVIAIEDALLEVR